MKNFWSLYEIDREKLCDLIAPGSVLGYTKEAFARETGLAEGIPLVSAEETSSVQPWVWE